MNTQQQVKNPALAAFLSFLWPGLGQLYNGQVGKGIVIMIVQFINVLLAGVIIGLVTGFAVLVWAIYDAYKTAEQINVEASERALQNYKVCPQCAERVPRDARICRYCGYQFYPAPVATLPAPLSQPLQTTSTNTLPDTNTAAVGATDTKYCPNCGGANSPSAKFCIECGYAFQQTQTG